MGIIEIKDFSFAYGNNSGQTGGGQFNKRDVKERAEISSFNTKAVIKHADLIVGEGEFFVLCGKSGCGKTTLLRSLKKSIAPYGDSSGEIIVAGKNIRNIAAVEESGLIGFVMQNPDNQIVTDKVWHELAFGLESLGVPNKIIRVRVAEMSAYFGIDDWFHKDVAKLSGGQKQLLNLAGVMAMNPKILILDEPTSQLDPIAAADFIETVRKINRDFGTTVVMTEHRLEEAVPVADRTAFMEDGEIKFTGGAAEMAQYLYDTGNDMFISMPSPVRIALECGGRDVLPLTVGAGKRWLEKKVRSIDENSSGVPDNANENTFAPEDKKQEAVISIRDLYFTYEKGAKYVIDGLNLDLFRGETFSLLGGNGSGKSTLISLLSGVCRAGSGKIKINGKRIEKINHMQLYKGIIGVMPQSPQCLFARKTVGEELAEMNNEKDVDRVVELTRIGDLRERHPYDLSGGEQQRLALAKILLLNPQILLFDEPTKGMDGYYKRQFGAILDQLKRTGVTIFIVSHDVEFCAEYADRCGLLFDGKIVSTGIPREFFGGNTFYTTAANKISRNASEKLITTREVTEWLQRRQNV